MFLPIDGIIINTDMIVKCTPGANGTGVVLINDGTNNGQLVALGAPFFQRLVDALEAETIAIQKARAEVGRR